MKIADRFEGCIICGAIGDAWGSGHENITPKKEESIFYPFGKMPKTKPKWQITDDTQLTLATCEAISSKEKISPESIASTLLKYFKEKKITGVGASTLKAFRELELGGHWSLVGRKGEYAAGNGAAMRIAPLAFCKGLSEKEIYEICSITHQNDDAYVGALSVLISIREILNENWTGKENLFQLIIEQIPDTRLKDRLIEIDRIKDKSLLEIGSLGSNGYVVNSIPLAIAAAYKAPVIGIENMFETLIKIGGDTDTNASIAGQIIGTLVGIEKIPLPLKEKLQSLKSYPWINSTINDTIEAKGWG
jgi:ADP-ribosylglycohydrolase